MTLSIFRIFELLTGCSLTPSQIRHPERSAARIYRITEGFCAKPKDPGDVSRQMLFQAFPPQVLRQLTSARLTGVIAGCVPPHLTQLSNSQRCIPTDDGGSQGKR